MSNAYGYLTLSNQQTQYQNLVLQEEMVETYKKIEALVEQNQAGIKTLLDRDRERGAARTSSRASTLGAREKPTRQS